MLYHATQNNQINNNNNNNRGLGLNITNFSSSMTTPFTNKSNSNIFTASCTSYSNKDLNTVESKSRAPVFFIQDLDPKQPD